MGKVTCHGKMCIDEDTGVVFFLPDKECDPQSYAKVRQEASMDGVMFAKTPIEKQEASSPQPWNKEKI